MIQWVSHQILFLFSNISKPEYFRHCDRVLLFLHCDQPGPFCGLAVRVHVGTFRERGGGSNVLSRSNLSNIFSFRNVVLFRAQKKIGSFTT